MKITVKIKTPPELYLSVDVEADGPIPGPHSMLSFAAVALYKGQTISTFSRNLVTLENAYPDPKTTTEFWDKNREAYEETRKNQVDPKAAMTQFASWVEDTRSKCGGAKAVFVAYPWVYF